MTIPQALAKYPMQISAQLIRVWAQSVKGCPFCEIVRDGNRRTYIVNEARLIKWINGESTDERNSEDVDMDGDRID